MSGAVLVSSSPIPKSRWRVSSQRADDFHVLTRKQRSANNESQAAKRNKCANGMIQLPTITNAFPIGWECLGRPLLDLVIKRDIYQKGNGEGSDEKYKATKRR